MKKCSSKKSIAVTAIISSSSIYIGLIVSNIFISLIKFLSISLILKIVENSSGEWIMKCSNSQNINSPLLFTLTKELGSLSPNFSKSLERILYLKMSFSCTIKTSSLDIQLT
ncbi:hypothetical protein KBG23_01985 [Candidatus Dojkabacteria bacterium]|nr:hypothetical protein [Candidatus Dojkabacteria bacterium]